MLRGNVDTRLRKLDEGQYDAIVLAAAGLRRLGCEDRIRELLAAGRHVSGGGAGRAGDRDAHQDGGAARAGRAIGSRGLAHAVTAERALLAALEGGCQVPIGAHAMSKDRDHSFARDRGVAGRVAHDPRRLIGGLGDDPRQRRRSSWRHDIARARRARNPGVDSLRAHEGLSGGRRPRRSRTDHRQRPQDSGARRFAFSTIICASERLLDLAPATCRARLRRQEAIRARILPGRNLARC